MPHRPNRFNNDEIIPACWTAWTNKPHDQLDKDYLHSADERTQYWLIGLISADVRGNAPGG